MSQTLGSLEVNVSQDIKTSPDIIMEVDGMTPWMTTTSTWTMLAMAIKCYYTLGKVGLDPGIAG